MVNMRIQRPRMRIWLTALKDCEPLTPHQRQRFAL
jgi:hypothetical protein